jgi:hypothetical protein
LISTAKTTSFNHQTSILINADRRAYKNIELKQVEQTQNDDLKKERNNTQELEREHKGDTDASATSAHRKAYRKQHTTENYTRTRKRADQTGGKPAHARGNTKLTAERHR